jgi:hypothetical protein
MMKIGVFSGFNGDFNGGFKMVSCVASMRTFASGVRVERFEGLSPYTIYTGFGLRPKQRARTGVYSLPYGKHGTMMLGARAQDLTKAGHDESIMRSRRHAKAILHAPRCDTSVRGHVALSAT